MHTIISIKEKKNPHSQLHKNMQIQQKSIHDLILQIQYISNLLILLPSEQNNINTRGPQVPERSINSSSRRSR